MQASLRASGLVCAAVQIAYLIEEGLELVLVERAHGPLVWTGYERNCIVRSTREEVQPTT
jgi:hypothetical protein